MCKQHNPRKIDKCMLNLLWALKGTNYKVIMCCCGHRKYPMTMVCKDTTGQLFELMHMVTLPRKKRAYVKDKQGYYYIPEVMELYKKKRKVW